MLVRGKIYSLLQYFVPITKRTGDGAKACVVYCIPNERFIFILHNKAKLKTSGNLWKSIFPSQQKAALHDAITNCSSAARWGNFRCE